MTNKLPGDHAAGPSTHSKLVLLVLSRDPLTIKGAQPGLIIYTAKKKKKGTMRKEGFNEKYESGMFTNSTE